MVDAAVRDEHTTPTSTTGEPSPVVEVGHRPRASKVMGLALIFTACVTMAVLLWPEIEFETGLASRPCPYPTRTDPTANDDRTVPLSMRVVIPVIGVDVPVTGSSPAVGLKRGGYHHAGTADPGEGGNIVIAGHRIRRVFTLLHRLEPGDLIIVYNGGHEFDYRVDRVFEVGAATTSILGDSGVERLTLYTCTPRTLGNRRTVVWASPADGVHAPR